MKRRFTVCSAMLAILALAAASASAKVTTKETLKVESDRPISVIVKMSQPGGKLMFRGSHKKGEIQVKFPSESGATVTQDGNTVVIEGQQKPSTYTVMLPRGGGEVEVEINGVKHTIRKGYHSGHRIEFDIK